MNDLNSMLMQDEGMKLVVYDDANGKAIVPGSIVLGHPSIGIGRALDTDGITTEEAIYLRDNNILKCRQAAGTFPWFRGLDSVRQDVIVMLIFNMGLGGVCEFKNMLAAMARGDYTQAASELLASRWSAQVKARAVRLADLLRSGQYPST